MINFNKKNIIILVLSILIITIGVLVFKRQNGSLRSDILVFFGIGKEVTYEGYIIRNWEALYFTKESPFSDINGKDKIWVKDNNDDKVIQWEKSLKWNFINESKRAEYVKVRLEGKLYGPGVFGGTPGYNYEIDIHKIDQIFD